MERISPVNEEGVDAVLVTLKSPVAKNLVRMAVAAARMQFIRKDGQTEAAWRSELPISEFDMGFFARVVAEAFRNEEMLRAILNGSSIEEASGWDV
jgi:hypothetical protein